MKKLSDLYNISSRGNLRNEVSKGFVRPTVKQVLSPYKKGFEEVLNNKVFGNLFIDGEQSIRDKTLLHTITNVNNVTISTEQKKFGNSSLFFDGTNYLTFDNHDDWNFYTGDFTIDFWLKTTVDSSRKYRTLIAMNSNKWGIYIGRDENSGLIYYYTNNYSQKGFAFGTRIDDNIWHHVAVVRHNGYVNVYIDGISKLNSHFDSNLVSTSNMSIGYDTYNGFYTGYLDNIRLVKGQALWTSNFNLTKEELFI